MSLRSARKSTSCFAATGAGVKLKSLCVTQIPKSGREPQDVLDYLNLGYKAIVAGANYLSASVCHIDGQHPASVCASKGVTAATKALKLG